MSTHSVPVEANGTLYTVTASDNAVTVATAIGVQLVAVRAVPAGGNKLATTVDVTLDSVGPQERPSLLFDAASALDIYAHGYHSADNAFIGFIHHVIDTLKENVNPGLLADAAAGGGQK